MTFHRDTTFFPIDIWMGNYPLTAFPTLFKDLEERVVFFEGLKELSECVGISHSPKKSCSSSLQLLQEVEP